jgi:hypothetical protein
LRAYVLGLEGEKPEPVTEAPETFRFTTGETPYHQVVPRRKSGKEQPESRFLGLQYGGLSEHSSS